MDIHSLTKRGVVRGMHYQLPPKAQGKLVRCITGEILDVVVDIRTDSPTYASWISCRLSSENFHQLWLPKGFAHGFLTITDTAQVLYKLTDFWSREHERSIRWDDPTLLISWPSLDSTPELSEKDLCGSFISELNEKALF